MTEHFPPEGAPSPLGATPTASGVNFSIFSKSCTKLELLLFDHPQDSRPVQIIPFDPVQNRTYYYWHMFVPGIKAGQIYAYRADGPFDVDRGMRFNADKVLLDPYAKSIVNHEVYSRSAAIGSGDNCGRALKGVVVDPDAYDWEGDRPLQRPMAESVIYEMHVRGFTRHSSSDIPANQQGTYAGLIAKIPYLKSLGVTAVELLPIHYYDWQDAPRGLNYWGYSTIGFFAPHAPYSSDQSPLGPVTEFKDMVKALHQAGIEVILDVVYNHTAEGNHEGPTLSFRGLENEAYYHLAADMKHYANFSGTGNAINANHSIVRRMIIDSLHYWVEEMHVDGFRFDLASILARDEDGIPIKNPPIIWEIESDPVLAGTKLIAEAWDAAGLYQVGSFPGERWSEWNGRYRDDLRRFIRGDASMVGSMIQRILGSPDMYKTEGGGPNHSINFVTAHDGFVLRDLVSYNDKHNEANGENNRDGHNANYSWNCGREGETDAPEINELRRRQMKNFMTLLMFSNGIPMFLMGDEVRHTQMGNNNAYAQDNEISWFNWHAVTENRDMLRFVRNLIYFRKKYPFFKAGEYWTEGMENGPGVYITWHGTELDNPDWESASRTIVFELKHLPSEKHLYIIFNAFWQPLRFMLPKLEERERWHRIIDTGRTAPDDFRDPAASSAIRTERYMALPRSCVVLLKRLSY